MKATDMNADATTATARDAFPRTDRSRAYAFVLAAALASSAQAHPGESPAQTVGAASNSMSAEIAAVAAESDDKTRDDYTALKLAAANLPNERYRIEAARSAANGRWIDAARYFRLAARYADKYSQHRLSMLYWHGVGVERDRVEAYVWADLAAERGYPQFLAIREKMWAALTLAEQAAVPARGDAVYAEFGDPVAKRRVNDVLGHAKRKITGSRTGFVGALEISAYQKNGLLPNLFENAAVASTIRPERLDPDRYWQIEDRVWKDTKVTVGDLEATSLRPKTSAPRKGDAKP
jgi:hypothetical protein